MNILARITPTEDERNEMDDKVQRLLAAAQAALDKHKIPGTASVQGSIAKDTWLAGNTDVDLFLLLDPSLDAAKLKEVPEQIGPQILKKTRKKYAQHPYLLGEFEGLQVDLVPAYKIPDTTHKMSAVDRTPFHTQWVREHMQDAGQVRLAKQWSKGVGIYGADTATGGFSGYLLEVLVTHLGDFDAFVAWLAADAEPRRIAVTDDRVDDDVSCLVVVDPIDATRNCGAAVQEQVLARATHAAKAYQQSPSEAFFFPRPPAVVDDDTLLAALGARGETWVGLEMTPKTDRLDMVLPQFHRACRTFAGAFERAGFTVRAQEVEADERLGKVAMQWLLDDALLPETTLHEGPVATAQPNALRFADKWANHPDAIGPAREHEGKLVVEVRTPHRDPATWLTHFLPKSQTGKHVQAALQHSSLLTRPSDAHSFWAPFATDFILQRRPWQRP